MLSSPDIKLKSPSIPSLGVVPKEFGTPAIEYSESATGLLYKSESQEGVSLLILLLAVSTLVGLTRKGDKGN
jgi:hypothetical protein